VLSDREDTVERCCGFRCVVSEPLRTSAVMCCCSVLALLRENPRTAAQALRRRIYCVW